MKIVYAIVLSLFVLILTQSCRKDFDFEPSNGSLTFSKDTVYLDTIFSNIGSSTYTLKVYNQSSKNIQIPKIALRKGNASHYRLMVDGLSGKEFTNMELLAKDSLYVFIETTLNYEEFQNPETSFLYTDELLFHSTQETQTVDLVTLVKDAHFLYPKKSEEGLVETLPIGEDEVYGFYLNEQDPVFGNTLHWTADKPYVIYGYAGIPKDKELRIDADAAVYFHDNSGIIAAEGSKITAQGTLDKPILFQGNRLEYTYRYTPGQWGAIWLTPESSGVFEHVVIQNPTIGLFINKNKGSLILHNVAIYQASQYGILGQTATIQGENVVVGNAGIAAFACSLGGRFEFNHSSFVNFWNKPNHTAIWIDNGNGDEAYRLHPSQFTNCIIFSQATESMVLKPFTNEPTDFPLHFYNNLIRFHDRSNQFYGVFPYDFDNTNRYTDNLIQRMNQEYLPYFNDISKNKLQLTSESIGILGRANPVYSQETPFDMEGHPRLVSPNFGAYQTVFESE